MKRIMIILGGGRANGNTSQLAEAFTKGAKEAGHQVELVSLNKLNVNGCTGCNACRYEKPCVQKDDNPPFGRYERYPIHDCALLMTSADNFFWTFEQAVSYYNLTVINYIGFHNKGMLLAGGCGDTNGKPQINKTNHLENAYKFGKNIYAE